MGRLQARPGTPPNCALTTLCASASSFRLPVPQVGTFALAYAAHKALSPVRFPPTVALTPVVAKYLGKKKEESAGGSGSSN